LKRRQQTRDALHARPRFIFRGHAAAFGGRIIRPKEVILEAPGASALTVSGGRSAAVIRRTAFEDFLSVASGSTLAEGLFTDPARYKESTLGRIPRDELTAVTHVTADVLGLIVGLKPQLRVKRLRAALTASSPLGGNEPFIGIDKDTRIEGVSVDGFNLIVELQTAFFRRYDTYSKLVAAASDPRVAKELGDALFVRSSAPGGSAPVSGRIRQFGGTIYGTIVKSIDWERDAFPGSRIENNAVYIPGLGRLYFGELLITGASRRLTLLRAELGSRMGGDAAFADVQDNGGWGI
jgi:hypothetical protein